jgi:hypothetical protein
VPVFGSDVEGVLVGLLRRVRPLPHLGGHVAKCVCILDEGIDGRGVNTSLAKSLNDTIWSHGFAVCY